MATKETKHYVEFECYTGRFIDEHEVKEVDSYSIEGVEIPEYALAYRFFKQDVKRTEDDGDVFEKWSDRYDQTGWHFIGGTALGLDDIPNTPDNAILRDNLRYNSNYFQQVVRTRFGTYRPFKESDKVV